MTTIYERAGPGQQSSKLGDQELSDLLVKAALNDPKIVAKGFDSSRVFALVSVLLSSPSSPRKSLVKTMNTVYQFDITSDDSSSAGSTRTWYADMRKKGVVGLVKEGEKIPLKPDVTIRCSDRDFVSMATGKVPPQKLFAAQRIKVRGNLDKALNVEKIISHERKKLEGFAVPTKATLSKGAEKGRWAGMKTKSKSKL